MKLEALFSINVDISDIHMHADLSFTSWSKAVALSSISVANTNAGVATSVAVVLCCSLWYGVGFFITTINYLIYSCATDATPTPTTCSIYSSPIMA